MSNLSGHRALLPGAGHIGPAAAETIVWKDQSNSYGWLSERVHHWQDEIHRENSSAGTVSVIRGDFYCTSAKAARGLEAAGFRPARPDQLQLGFPARFQPVDVDSFSLTGAFWLAPELRSESGPLLEMDNFYITKSDGDQDRPN